MRLTEKRTIHPSCKINGELENREYIHIKDKNLAEKKLFELEDIEEELGIDLATLFKALKNGIWVKSKRNGIEYGKTVLIGNTFIHCSVYSTKYANNRGRSYKTMNIKDYGKTWALTKEELL